MKKFVNGARIAIIVVLLFTMLLPMGMVQASQVWVNWVKIDYDGQVMDSLTFDGHTVNAIYPVVAPAGTDTTYACFAYVTRFYSTVYGINVSGMWNSTSIPGASSGSFSATSNPRIGDIIRFNDPNSPHWAIVKSVDTNGTVTVIQQNARWNGCAAVGAYIVANDSTVTYFTYSNYVSTTPVPTPTPSGFSYIFLDINNEKVEITHFSPPAGNENLIIPSTLGGGSVTSIGKDAFAWCTSLTSITIPDSVTSIGNAAFSDCTSLTGITIPSSVTSIGDGAFYECSSLTSITIPSGVTSINQFLFFGCSNLSDIDIPSGVTSIGNGAFAGCSKLTGITIPSSVTSINEGLFMGCSKLSTIGMPGAVTSIGDYAFSGCSSLTSITIPDSVTSIGDNAFNECSSLTSILIPGGLKSIGAYAFYNCICMTAIDVDESNTMYDNIDGVLYSKGGTTLITCPGGKSGNLSIPNSVTSIDMNAFFGCIHLSSIEIPDSITSIGADQFFGCTSLSSIKIPGTVKSIGDRAFYGCTSLGSIEIPSGVTNIGTRMFYGCENLTSILIPSSVTSIGTEAFYECKKLDGIIIPNELTVIAESTFYDCESLSEITIPDTVTRIGWSAFEQCNSLTEISIPDSVTVIGRFAFTSCDNLKSITIGSGVESIGQHAFSYSAYKHVKFEGTISLIEHSAFYLGYCGYYGPIIFEVPVGTKSYYEGLLNNEVVGSYGGLTTAYVSETAAYFVCFQGGGIEPKTDIVQMGGTAVPPADPVLRGYTFTGWDIPYDNVTSDLTVNATYDDNFIYDSSTRIQYFVENDKAIIHGWFDSGVCVIPDTLGGYSVTEISESAFYYNDELTGIVIPSSVTSIGDYAFYMCTNLACVTIKGDVTSIGLAAFDIGAEKQIKFIVPADKITYYQSLLNANVMNATTAVVTAVVTDKYTVTFDTNGGIAGAGSDYTQQIAIDGLAVAPTNPPMCTGYTFAGWYKDYDCTQVWDFASDTVSKNTILYAAWNGVFQDEAKTREFVTRFYQLCLGREPDAGGLTYWADSLLSGSLSGADLSNQLVFSEEFRNRNVTNDEYITIMYKSFFGRDPDAGGKEYWMSVLDSGMSRYYILAGFVNSEEFKNICNTYGISVGSLAITAPVDQYPQITSFVTRFYKLCLNRMPDAAGLDHWVVQLQTQNLAGANVAHDIVTSEEFTNRGTTNDEFVEIMYKAFFDRTSEASGKAYWSGRLAAGTSRYTVLAGFVNSQEFTNICQLYAINKGTLS